LYLADVNNGLRKISKSGVVTTVTLNGASNVRPTQFINGNGGSFIVEAAGHNVGRYIAVCPAGQFRNSEKHYHKR
jgi:hypothetical protein